MIYTKDVTEKLKDLSISDYARIRIGPLSGILTFMLSLNAIGMTASFALLGGELVDSERAAITMFTLSASFAVLLALLAKGYLESLTHRFALIDADQMESIAKTAKRFYVPFMLSMIADVSLVVVGVLALIFHMQIW